MAPLPNPFLFSVGLLLISIRLIATECPPGRQGINCSFLCGHCTGSASCDSNSGSCPDGCEEGWKVPLCNISYPKLRDPPHLKEKNESQGFLIVTWKRWLQSRDIGEGTPSSYLVQLRDYKEGEWKSVYEVPAEDWTEYNDGFEVTVKDLTFDSDQVLRIAIKDQSGEMQLTAIPLLFVGARTDNVKNEDNKNNDNNNDDQNSKDSNNKTSADNNKTNSEDFSAFNDLIMEWLKWAGVAIGISIVLALVFILIVECCPKRSSKKIDKPKNTGTMELREPSGENNSYPSEGYVNSSYVTLRMENVRNMKPNVKQNNTLNKVDWSDKDKNHKLHSVRSNQRVVTLSSPNGKWREALPGFRESSADPASWYTEWYDSKVYENVREAPEELTVDQTRTMRAIPV